MNDKKVGDVVEAGELLLMTSGAYTDFGVCGLYRAKKQFTITGTPGPYSKPGEDAIDIHGISANPELVEELSYLELWRDS